MKCQTVEGNSRRFFMLPLPQTWPEFCLFELASLSRSSVLLFYFPTLPRSTLGFSCHYPRSGRCESVLFRLFRLIFVVTPIRRMIGDIRLTGATARRSCIINSRDKKKLEKNWSRSLKTGLKRGSSPDLIGCLCIVYIYANVYIYIYVPMYFFKKKSMSQITRIFDVG